MQDAAARWGLPPGFAPIRFPISQQVKDVVRDLLGANDPVIISLSNESDTIAIIATPQRLLTARTGATAGVTGCTIRDFPYEAITNLTLQQAALNVKISIGFRSADGRTPEVGVRARMGKPTVEHLMPFETNAGTQVFEALHAIWTHKITIPPLA